MHCYSTNMPPCVPRVGKTRSNVAAFVVFSLLLQTQKPGEAWRCRQDSGYSRGVSDVHRCIGLSSQSGSCTGIPKHLGRHLAEIHTLLPSFITVAQVLEFGQRSRFQALALTALSAWTDLQRVP